METLLELLKKTTAFFEKKGFKNPRLQSELLFAGALKKKRLELYLNFDQPLTTDEVDKLRSWVVRRSKNEPIQYIVGDTDFRNITLKCDSRALIPRSETEELVELILQKIKENKYQTSPSILELGTGTGAIAISLALETVFSKLVAVDISESALSLAIENAEIIGGAAKSISFVKSNWFENVSGKYDIIISNPPYLTYEEWDCADSEVKDFEPKNALVADDAGVADLQIILEKAPVFLNENGWVGFETGIAQHDKLKKIANALNYKETESLTDLENRPRFFFAKI